MSKRKDLLGGSLNHFISEEYTEDVIETPAVEDKPKVGRPRTIDRKITKSSQEGLPVNETRYTVIIKEDLLAEVKAYKDDSGKSMKAIVDEAFCSYIERMKEENQ